MDWYKIFYLFSLADKISCTMYFLALISSGIVILGLLGYIIGSTEEVSRKTGLPISKALMRKFWIPAIVCWFLWAFIPDRQDMTLIVAGGSVGQFIVRDDNAKELPADITRFLRSEILDATANLSSSVKKDLGIKTRRDSLMDMGKDQLIKMLEND